MTPDNEPGDRDGGSLLHAPDAEFALLAEVTYRPTAIREASAVVAPEDFANTRYRQVYALIAGLVSAAENPDSVTPLVVRAEIKARREEQAKNLGGVETTWLDDGELAAVMTSSTGYWQQVARLVVEASVRRRTVEAAQRTIGEAMRAAGDPTLLAQSATERFAEIRDLHVRPGRLAASSLGDVFDEEDDAYDWVIPGLLERRDRLIVTGVEGKGKSTLLRQIIIAASAGVHPFSLEPTKPARVLVVDAENSRRQWKRKARSVAIAAAQAGTANPRDMVQLVCVGRMDLTGPSDLAAIHALLDEHTPDILVLSPLYKMLPREITNDTDAAPLIAALDSFRDRPDGPCLLMEAHSGHGKTSSGSRDPRPRGSSALLGWPEFGFGLVPDRDFPDVAVDVVRWRGDRDERDWPSRLIRGGVFPWSDESQRAARPSTHDQERSNRYGS